MDATIITAASKKQGAAATWKKPFGFHPLAAWCANTSECLAMLLRAGNAGSNTVVDHIRVLREALAQVPGASTAKMLVRVEGAGATQSARAPPEVGVQLPLVHLGCGADPIDAGTGDAVSASCPGQRPGSWGPATGFADAPQVFVWGAGRVFSMLISLARAPSWADRQGGLGSRLFFPDR